MAEIGDLAPEDVGLLAIAGVDRSSKVQDRSRADDEGPLRVALPRALDLVAVADVPAEGRSRGRRREVLQLSPGEIEPVDVDRERGLRPHARDAASYQGAEELIDDAGMIDGLGHDRS